MDPTPKTCVDHFTHPHPLTPTADDNQQFFCNGCRTNGIGKRFRCNACNFNFHGFCANCPRSLSSFMHPHPLTLLVPNPASSTAVDCDLCRETAHGLFYRCDDCNFDMHPICTQLPERINHILDRSHPLILQTSPGDGASTCAVCGRLCAGWRYACRACRVDIHKECVLDPVVGHKQHVLSSTGQQGIPIFNQNIGIPTAQQGIPMFHQNMGIPFHAPPHTYTYPHRPMFHQNMGIPFHAPPHTYTYPHGPMFHQNMGIPFHAPPHTYTYPHGNIRPHNSQVGANNNHNRSRSGKSLFDLVMKLGLGVIPNMVFGVDIYGLY